MATNCEWISNPLMIAERLIKTIAKGELNIDAIDVRARAHGIDMRLLDQALAILHRNKHIATTTKKGTIWYSIKVAPTPKAPGSHLTWVRHNYPPMTKENDGSGIEADYSYMFLSPEEADKYRAELTGRTYVPKKKYAAKKPKVYTAQQQSLINMFTK